MDVEFEMSPSPEEMTEQLRELQSNLEDNWEAAAEEAALRVLADARRNAPVDTGRLRADISHDVQRLGEHIVRVAVGNNVEYAPFQEIDTRYLRSAFEDNLDRIEELFTDAVDMSVEEADLR